MRLAVHRFAAGILLNAFLGLVFLFPFNHGNENVSASSTCNRLLSQLGPEIIQSSGQEYLDGATNAWNLLNAEQRPACIVFPRSASHVQTAMKAIFRDQVRYAVQAGSHSAMKGWNNVESGILILFSHMKNVTYDPIEDTITLQPGIHWGEALAALEPQGVAPMGGRLNGVGTGLLLGGGLSFLSAEHGFSVDALKEADVVLVTGKLVTATSNNSYSDLFRALKGGANRFGIVTRYEVYAIHTGTNDDKEWFGGSILYSNDSASALIEATARYVNNVNDPKAALLVAFLNTAVEGAIIGTPFVTPFYRGKALPDNIFGDFLALPSIFSSLGPLSYVEVASVIAGGDQRGFGQIFGASAFSGGVDQYTNAFRHWNNYTDSIKDSLNGSALAFTPIQKSQILASRARGRNVIDPPLKPYAAVQVQTELASGVLAIPSEVESGLELLLSQIPRSAGIPLYVNECHAPQKVFETYGGFEFLKRTYAKYDPTRFNVRFTEGPIGL